MIIFIKIFCLILIIISVASLPQDTFAHWPLFGQNFTKNNLSDHQINGPLEVKWTLSGFTSPNKPVVSIDGTIYLSSIYKFAAVSPEGQQKWAGNLYGEPVTATAGDNGNIYIPTIGCNPYLYSFDPNGNRLWKYDMRQTGGLCGYNNPTRINLSPDQKTLYVGAGYTWMALVAFNTDGSIKWATRLGGFNSPSSSPVVSPVDGSIYLGTGGDGKLFAFTSEGVAKWNRHIGSGGPTVRVGNVTVGPDNNIYAVSSGASQGEVLNSFDPLGNSRWLYRLPGGSWFGPDLAIKGNAVYIIEESSNKERRSLHAIDTNTGNLLWKWSPPDFLSGSLKPPIIDKNGTIFLSWDKTLYAVSPEGQTLWFLTLGSYISSFVIGGDNLMYLTFSSGDLAALANLQPTPAPAPEPFLDLPWDYQGKGLSFNEAAQAMSSYFDHEYPLLSTNLNELEEAGGNIVSFRGLPRKSLSYSSHDGYDYAKLAKVNIGDPVLAAAAGEATYVNTCVACGNMILIDHKNGYQTRYLHLQKDGLIAAAPEQKVTVNAGQPVGKVGATGNVVPAGDRGAHIHFGVFQDKNKDGNFEDNIPDGATDPFGWQSKDPDPWPLFEFKDPKNGKTLWTGNKSYYLWTKKLDNLDSTLTSNGGVFKTSRATLNFPEGATNQNLNINIQSSPVVKISNILSSIGSTITATAKDALGNLVTQFNNLFTITISFKDFDLGRFKQDTVSIYSSPDNINWHKETTSINWTEKTASAALNHFTYFALMAERADVLPPTTSANLTGDKGQDNWFRSDVRVNLDARDNEGGSGVDYTMYKVDDGDWQQYLTPVNFAGEGRYKIEFYSADLDENLEDIQSIEFDIDKTAPDAAIDANPKSLWPPNGKMVDITVTGNSSDNHPGSTNISIDDEYNLVEPAVSNFGQTIRLEAQREGGDLDGRVYIIKVVAEDLAGNITEKQTQVIVAHDQGKKN
ncbi:peptidoglycan DD-metalloendopeptidase family protein [Candidatus Daviesbacteria bacterium]|nr:peptidoglycan DD-metalloendopeptidase family protein [Candidatus Daviesbacteria bacterium]